MSDNVGGSLDHLLAEKKRTLFGGFRPLEFDDPGNQFLSVCDPDKTGHFKKADIS